MLTHLLYTDDMKQAARAIILEEDKILVMHRNNEGNQYFTLVGGKVDSNETPEQALVREVREETGLEVVSARLVFIEDHPEPYNHQFVYLCEVAPHGEVAIQDMAEEAILNKLSINIHQPMWANLASFPTLAFRTPQLQQAIIEGINKGFPEQPITLN